MTGNNFSDEQIDIKNTQKWYENTLDQLYVEQHVREYLKSTHKTNTMILGRATSAAKASAWQKLKPKLHCKISSFTAQYRSESEMTHARHCLLWDFQFHIMMESTGSAKQRRFWNWRNHRSGLIRQGGNAFSLDMKMILDMKLGSAYCRIPSSWSWASPRVPQSPQQKAPLGASRTVAGTSRCEPPERWAHEQTLHTHTQCASQTSAQVDSAFRSDAGQYSRQFPRRQAHEETLHTIKSSEKNVQISDWRSSSK